MVKFHAPAASPQERTITRVEVLKTRETFLALARIQTHIFQPAVTKPYQLIHLLQYKIQNPENVFNSLLPNPTPWSTALLEKLTGSQPVTKYPAFYRTRRFITTLTTARHLPYSGADQSCPCPPPPHPRVF